MIFGELKFVFLLNKIKIPYLFKKCIKYKCDTI